jgi:hypothetical protein
MEVLLLQSKNWLQSKNARCSREAMREKQKRRRPGWRCGVGSAGYLSEQRVEAAVAFRRVLLDLRMGQPATVVSILYPVPSGFASQEPRHPESASQAVD